MARPRRPGTRPAGLTPLQAAQRAELLRRDALVGTHLDSLAAHTVASIQPHLDRVLADIRTARDAGEPLTQAQLLRSERVQALLHEIATHQDAYAAQASQTVAWAQQMAAQLGAADAQTLVSDAAGGLPPGTWNRLPRAQMERLVGTAGNGAPLDTLFQGYGAEAAQAAKATLLTGVALGTNPDSLAGQLGRDLGIARNRARVVARDTILGAYRSSAAESFRANADVVLGWRWSAAIGSACICCSDLDGTIHPLDEDLVSHHLCRCSAEPITRSYDDILSGDHSETLDDYGDGRDDEGLSPGDRWLAAQDAATQRQVIGTQAGYDAYRVGNVTAADFVGTKRDAQWGPSRYQKSLKELGIAPSRIPLR